MMKKLGEQQLKEVVHLFRNTTDTWYHIEINNEKITCTKEHPYWIPNLKSWVNAGDLKVGMNVLLSNGNYGTINSVEIEHLETPETTYNFEVRDFHTYYVGQSNVLVHNDCITDDLTKAMSKQYHPNTDCSEIAEELMKVAGGKGEIINITGKGGKWIRVLENGQISQPFQYHQVFRYAGKVFDPRYSLSPTTSSAYFGMVESLNPFGIITKIL